MFQPCLQSENLPLSNVKAGGSVYSFSSMIPLEQSPSSSSSYSSPLHDNNNGLHSSPVLPLTIQGHKNQEQISRNLNHSPPLSETTSRKSFKKVLNPLLVIHIYLIHL